MKLSATKLIQSEGDYSGLDVTNKEFQGIDLRNSVFNGTYFIKVKFLNCNLQHTEFTEAKFEDCLFEACNMDYCDFVFLSGERTRFINCTFTNAEWRENNFFELDFVKCNFLNSTISLCTFSKTTFDIKSSENFCGATKRFNVFSRSVFELYEDKIDFLTVNYGIQRPTKDAEILLSPKNKKDLFLFLSVSKYLGKLDTYLFVNLISSIGNELSSARQKNHIQKIKYLILICRLAAMEDTISVFGVQLLINELNIAAKKITESVIFMEMVDLIMFLKTHQYKMMKAIEVEVEGVAGQYADTATFYCLLENSYKKEDVRKLANQLADFLAIPREEVILNSFYHGSTVFELVIKCSASVGGFLLFINFSLRQVHKTIDYLAKIKKNIKYLRKKKNDKGKNQESIEKENSQQGLAVVPFAVMNNEGNIYYTQVTNIINIHGTGLIKIDGPGEIKIATKKAKGG